MSTVFSASQIVLLSSKDHIIIQKNTWICRDYLACWVLKKKKKKTRKICQDIKKEEEYVNTRTLTFKTSRHEQVFMIKNILPAEVRGA